MNSGTFRLDPPPESMGFTATSEIASRIFFISSSTRPHRRTLGGTECVGKNCPAEPTIKNTMFSFRGATSFTMN